MKAREYYDGEGIAFTEHDAMYDREHQREMIIIIPRARNPENPDRYPRVTGSTTPGKLYEIDRVGDPPYGKKQTLKLRKLERQALLRYHASLAATL
jgi:hypothetical protein